MAVLRLVVGFFRFVFLNLEGIAQAGRTEVKPGFRFRQAPLAPPPMPSWLWWPILGMPRRWINPSA